MVGSGNPVATHCNMPFTSLSCVRISGFAGGREKQPYVRLLENLIKAPSTISESLKTFSRLKRTLREHVAQRGECKPVNGRCREVDVRV